MGISTIDYLSNNIRKLGCWLRSPREVRHYMNRALWEAGFPWTKLSPTALDTIFPGIDYSDAQITVQNPFTRLRGTSMELDELMATLAIVRHTKASKIVEIGTFDGNTTLNLALNVGETGRVVTIDLPPEGLESENQSGIANPAEFERRQYVGEAVEARVTQVYGDSATLDWQGLGGPFDLAFIDGDHTAPYVLSDTRNTLSVLKPGGTILWHDYELKGVASVLDRAVSAGETIHWIAGTRLAVATFSDPQKSAERFRMESL